MIRMVICFKKNISIETKYKNKHPSAFADEPVQEGNLISFWGN